MTIDRCNPNLNSVSGYQGNQAETSVHEVIEHPLSDLRFLSNPLHLTWNRGFIPWQFRQDTRAQLFFPDREIEDWIVRSRSFRQTAITSIDDLDPNSLKQIYEQALHHLFPKGTSIQIASLNNPAYPTLGATFQPSAPDTIFINLSSDITQAHLNEARLYQATIEKIVMDKLVHELTHRKQYYGPEGTHINRFIRQVMEVFNDPTIAIISDSRINHTGISVKNQTCADLLLAAEKEGKINSLIEWFHNSPLDPEPKLQIARSYLMGLVVDGWADTNHIVYPSSLREAKVLALWRQCLKLQDVDQLILEQETYRVSTIICPGRASWNNQTRSYEYEVHYQHYEPQSGFSLKTQIETLDPAPPTWGRKARQYVDDLVPKHPIVGGFGLLADFGANMMCGLDWVNYFTEKNNSDCPDYNKKFDLGIALFSTGATAGWFPSLFSQTPWLKALGGRIAGISGAGAGWLASIKDFVVDLNDDHTTAIKTFLNGLDIVANTLILGSSLYFGIESENMGRLAPLASTMVGTAVDIGAKIAKSFC